MFDEFMFDESVKNKIMGFGEEYQINITITNNELRHLLGDGVNRKIELTKISTEIDGVQLEKLLINKKNFNSDLEFTLYYTYNGKQHKDYWCYYRTKYSRNWRLKRKSRSKIIKKIKI